MASTELDAANLTSADKAIQDRVRFQSDLNRINSQVHHAIFANYVERRAIIRNLIAAELGSMGETVIAEQQSAASSSGREYGAWDRRVGSEPATSGADRGYSSTFEDGSGI